MTVTGAPSAAARWLDRTELDAWMNLVVFDHLTPDDVTALHAVTAKLLPHLTE